MASGGYRVLSNDQGFAKVIDEGRGNKRKFQWPEEEVHVYSDGIDWKVKIGDSAVKIFLSFIVILQGGEWECSDCKNGKTRRKRTKHSRKANRRQQYRDVSEEESDEEVQRSRSSSRKKVAAATSQERKGRTRSSGSRNSSMCEPASSLTPTSRSSRRGPSELSLCEEVLNRVIKHKLSWPFLEPVDKKQVPDYYTLIKKPMDFQTMQKKCTRLSYASPQEFIEDAALVFENAESYNKPDTDVFSCMREVEKVFKEQLKKLLPDWPYYRTVVEHDGNSSGSEAVKRRSRNK